MRIGIDIDETITNTHIAALEYAREIFKDKKIKTYEEALSIPGFLNEHIAEIQRRVKLKPDASKALNKLKQLGHEIIIITARGAIYNYDYRGITEKLLNDNNVPYDKIYYQMEIKGNIAKAENLDYYIDDKEMLLDQISIHGIKCFRFVDDMKRESKYQKFDNWEDIVDYIKVRGD